MNNEPQSQVLLYQATDGASRLEVRMEDETVWLSLNQMAELFQRDKSVISKHIKNIFDEGELKPESVVAKFATTAADGKTYQVDYYNLDVDEPGRFSSKRPRKWQANQSRSPCQFSRTTAKLSDWSDLPVTFGPNRRVGAAGSFIVGIDLGKKQYVVVSERIVPK